MTNKKVPSGKRQDPHRTLLPVFFSCLFIIGVIAALELTNTTHFFHKPPETFKTTPTTGGASSSNQKGEVQSGSGTPGATNPTPTGTSKGDTTATTPLIAPSGDFVSNHTPGQNGTSLIETSVCNTTSGATCQISFTMNGKTVSLDAETTDAGGSAYWNGWTPQPIGLTPGSWQITATATLGDQTKTAADSRPLVVM